MKKKYLKVTSLIGALAVMSVISVSAAEIAPRQSGNFYEYNISRFQENNYLPGAKKVTEIQNITFEVTKISVTEKLEVWGCNASNTQVTDNSYFTGEATKNLYFNTRQNKDAKVTVGWQNANWSGYTGKVSGWVDYN